jgi:hypothetical protein
VIDGSIQKVFPDYLASIINKQSTSIHKISFPSWLGNSQKVMYLHDGMYKMGLMEWDLDNSICHFSRCHHSGTKIFGVDLPDFFQHFQQYIEDDILVQVWHGGHKFHIAGIACQISASNL